MKRSEMVKLMIETQLNPPEDIKNINDGGAQLIRLMEHMLTKMEKAGMKPPHVRIPGVWQTPNDNCVWEEE